MKHARWVSNGLASVIALSALVAGIAWYGRGVTEEKAKEEHRAEQAAVATTAVVQCEFELGVNVTGRLEAVKFTPVTSAVQGQVIRVVPNGSPVNKGDVVVELDAPRMARQVREFTSQYDSLTQETARRKKDLAAEVEKAQLSVEESEQQLAQFKESQKLDLDTTRRQYEYDVEDLGLVKARYERKQRQVKEALVPATELEASEADIKSREFGLEKARKDLELAEARQKSDLMDKERAAQRAKTALGRSKDEQQDQIRNLQMRLQTLKQQLDRAKEQLGQATVRAPAAGIVVLASQDRTGQSQELAPGDTVWATGVVATIPDLSQMRVALELTQEQVRQVKKGRKVRVRVETAPGKTFRGEVTEISQNAQPQRGGWGNTGERVFQTTVLLKELKGAYLRPGTTAQATIIIERLPKVLVLPLECVFDRDGKKVVYVARGGGFRPVEVQLGPQNEDMVVVKKGLKRGDRAAMHDLKGLGREESSGPPGKVSAPF